VGWFGKSTRNDGVTAVVTDGDSTHVACVARPRGATPCVTFHRTLPGSDIKRLIDRSPAASYPATTLLDRGDYQLLLVEAPDVRPDELRAAVRWRIKDLIGFHIDDAIIDVFEIPDQRHLNRNRMMYAVAARARRVSERAELIEDAGLAVDVVDIPEMAVRNLAMLLPEESNGLAFIHMNEHGGLITISRQGILYLTRRFDTGVRELNDADEDARDKLCDGILLEVQRSLDYYESHYPHGPVSSALALSPSAAASGAGRLAAAADSTSACADAAAGRAAGVRSTRRAEIRSTAMPFWRSARHCGWKGASL
jgi:MSHA biogenesis protein MshI